MNPEDLRYLLGIGIFVAGALVGACVVKWWPLLVSRVLEASMSMRGGGPAAIDADLTTAPKGLQVAGPVEGHPVIGATSINPLPPRRGAPVTCPCSAGSKSPTPFQQVTRFYELSEGSYGFMNDQLDSDIGFRCIACARVYLYEELCLKVKTEEKR